MKILVPSITPLHPELPADHTTVEYEGSDVPAEHRDAEVLVVWGGNKDQNRALLDQLPNLRWIQALAAGPDALLAAGVSPDIRISTGNGLHDRTVSEHALTLALQLVTRAPEAAQAQREKRWDVSLARARPLQEEDHVSSIIDARVLIWGFGSIGQHLAELVSALGAASVRGVARSAGTRRGYEVVTEDAIDAALAETDILFMVLPHSEATAKALNAERLAALPARSIVVNVGRGTTVDEDALVAALREGRLYGAGLDVTAVEPLPEDSPLWDAPNTIITPHQAGFRADGGEELLAQNLAKFEAGEKLRNEVER